jgi:hypothetical protein
MFRLKPVFALLFLSWYNLNYYRIDSGDVMYYRDAGYGHGKGKFEKESPFDLLATIIRSDNYQVMHLSFRAESLLKSLDASIAFYIELLQVAYKNRINWQGDPQIKAGIAMANTTLNHLLIARHAVILGYGAEAQMLYRGCFERMTSAVVFQIDAKLAKLFWSGKQINQFEINDAISLYLESKHEKGTFKQIYESYKQNWKMLSELSHPNLETVMFRILSIEGRSIDESIGIDIGLGGMTNESVISGIIGLMTQITFSLSLMRIFVSEFLGKWNKKLDDKYVRLTNMGFDLPLTELERQIEFLERHRPPGI